MRTTKALRGIGIVLLAAAVLISGGCLGGSQNFSPVGDIPGNPLAISAGARSDGSAQVGPRIGNVAPDFTLKDLDGNTVRLSDLRGKPVVVNFWASWCPPCKDEMPVFESAYKKYRDQGVVFLGVDLQEDADTVRKFVKQGGYDWTFLLDPNSEASRSYLVTGVPESYFVDREGIVRDSAIGPLTASGLEAKLARIR